jgi:hypothetical protein
MRRQINSPSRVDRLSKNFIDHPATPTSVTGGNPRRAAVSPRASWPTDVPCANPVGKPDAGNRHVRFDSNSRYLRKFPVFFRSVRVQWQQIPHVGPCRGGARATRDRLKQTFRAARRTWKTCPSSGRGNILSSVCLFSPSNSGSRWHGFDQVVPNRIRACALLRRAAHTPRRESPQ